MTNLKRLILEKYNHNNQNFGDNSKLCYELKKYFQKINNLE